MNMNTQSCIVSPPSFQALKRRVVQVLSVTAHPSFSRKYCLTLGLNIVIKFQRFLKTNNYFFLVTVSTLQIIWIDCRYQKSYFATTFLIFCENHDLLTSMYLLNWISFCQSLSGSIMFGLFVVVTKVTIRFISDK